MSYSVDHAGRKESVWSDEQEPKWLAAGLDPAQASRWAGGGMSLLPEEMIGAAAKESREGSRGGRLGGMGG